MATRIAGPAAIPNQPDGDTPSVASFRSRLPVYALLVTSTVSIFGNTLTALAVPWFVLETTGSASRTGITAAVVTIPMIISSFFGGTLVDRTGYRALSVFSDLVSAVTVALVPFFYLTMGLNFSGLLVLMFLGSIFDTPGSTARSSMMPQLSRRSSIPLERINANFGMIYSASTLFAAPFAGLMIAWLGPVHTLWFNAGSFVFSGLAVLVFIPALTRPDASGQSFMSDVRTGLGYVMHDRLLRTLILFALIINMMFAPVFGVAIPFYANQDLESAKALGIILGGEGLGGLLGAFLYGKFGTIVPRYRLLLVSVVLLTTPLFLLATSPALILTTAFVVLVGVGSGIVNPMIGTFLQQWTPAHMLGRVGGLVRAGAQCAQPLGLLLGGTLIAVFGIRGTFLLAGIVMLAVVIAIVLSPALRLINADPPAQSTSDAHP